MIKMECNHNHKKGFLSLKKTVSLGIYGGAIALSLFSGSEQIHASTKMPIAVTETKKAEDSSVIPDDYIEQVAKACGKDIRDEITQDDLRNIFDLKLYITQNTDLQWLNDCTNLKDFMLFFTDSNADTMILRDIDRLENLNRFTVVSGKAFLDINEDDFSFLYRSPNLESVQFTGFTVEPKFLEPLTQIKRLKLSNSSPSSNLNIDFSKLTYLEELDFGLSAPYDIPVYFSNEDLNILKDHGVKVVMEEEAKVTEVNNKLDSIVANLGVTKDSSEREKLDAILVYVLQNLTYDVDVMNALTEHMDTENTTRSFYQEGFLYGAFEKESAICGNYAALVQALSKRVDLNTSYLISDNHAWNLVEVEGEYYYVDATWLDGQTIKEQHTETVKDKLGNTVSQTISVDKKTADQLILSGETDQLDWYMEDPLHYPASSNQTYEEHEALNLPSYLQIELQETNRSSKDMATQKFKIKIGSKVFLVTGGVLIGIMSAFGMAVGISKHRENQRRKKRELERRRNYQLDSNYIDYSSYDHKRKR